MKKLLLVPIVCLLLTIASFSQKTEVFMSHPANREHPEPMRVWPENQNVHGDVFIEFCPIRYNDWVLDPGIVYRLKYRMLVYDSKVDPAVSERIWTDFAYPPVVKIVK